MAINFDAYTPLFLGLKFPATLAINHQNLYRPLQV
jgi:hypothetical protein